MANKELNKTQKGYTLLEYCAGAALIAGIIWVALNAMGQNITALLNAIGQWAVNRAGGIN
jgi:hypothetical protein